MNAKELVHYCNNALVTAGAEKAQCLLGNAEKHELNVANNQVSLLRTTYNSHVALTGILDQKKGTLAVNKLDQIALDSAVKDVIELAQASEADPAHDIAEQQPPQELHARPEAPELDLMYAKLTRFLAHAKQTYPTTILEEITFDFTLHRSYFQNSNGVDFVSQQGNYNFAVMFTSKEGKQSSSFNYSGFSTSHLDKDLHEFGSIDTLLRQSGEQISTRMLPERMVGDVILTPDCVGDFVAFVTGFLDDYPLIAGTSVFKDKLHKIIAAESLTLRAMPVAKDMASGYFFTHDGYAAQNSVIIERGLLNTFLLSLYGSRKIRIPRAVNEGGAYVIEPGHIPLDRMIKSVEKGILLGRFSGGDPSDNGDFSGVAKNSYYIADGKIQYPLSETMIAGNLTQLLKNIRSISQERIHFGNAIFPWIQVSDMMISGK